MESEISLKQRGGNLDVVVEIQSQSNGETTVANEELSRVQMNLFTPPDLAAKPPLGATVRRRSPPTSDYSKPKSRILEPPYPSNSNPAQEGTQNVIVKASKTNSPNVGSPLIKVNPSSPKTSGPVTPRTPLMSAVGGDDDDDDDDDEVYKTENVIKVDKKKRRKKVKLLVLIEWIAFVCIMAVLIASLTVDELQDWTILDAKLWRWSVLVLVIFCGHLFTEWLTHVLVFLIERNFLLKKKVLYFVFGLRNSGRVVVWLGLILLAWGLLINRGVKRSRQKSKVLNRITRGIASSLIGAIMWMVKTLLIKILASSFHVRTYFDRIQESIFHQYILQALLGPPLMENAIENSGILSSRLSFKCAKRGRRERRGEELINVDRLNKMKRGKVSAWTMKGLIKVIRGSGLPTISDVLDETIEDEGETKVITSEVEARDAANRIFKNVAKHGHKFIDEGDLLRFMPKEEVDNAFPLFEGAVETRRIKKSSFRNWVVKSYNERKCLAVSLKDAKTAIEELNKIASGVILIVIIIVWILVMEIATVKVLVFISSQMLLVVFIFGNTAKTVFEAIIFVFVVHPFDVGDRCVIDGVQMTVEEMNILTTIFLKSDNEKVYYPNAILATKPISNFNRSPEMMGDAVEFSVDFSTSVESIAALRAKIKTYLESKPQQWHPGHSVQIKEIEDVNKMRMALYVTHTINFQNSSERGNRRSDLVLELKRIFEELGIKYRLLPQEVHISYIEPTTPNRM